MRILHQKTDKIRLKRITWQLWVSIKILTTFHLSDKKKKNTNFQGV